MDEITYKGDINKTTNAIISSDLLDELIAIRDSFDMNYWRLGDITNVVISQAVASGAENIKMILYARIGQVVGKSPKAIRYYAAISGFYQDEVRERHQLLTFSHFAYAMKFRDPEDITFSETSKTSEILEFAMTNAEEFHGMPPSVALLQRRFEGAPELPADIMEKRLPPSPILDNMPIMSNGGYDRSEVVANRKQVSLQRLASLTSQIVPIIQFLDNPELERIASQLVEKVRLYLNTVDHIDEIE